jgi:outer membrane protein OmpA-like peptidoglycan-associated protein
VGAPAVVTVAFRPASAVLDSEAQQALRTLAAHRGDKTVQVIGYGDALTGDPAAQAAALPLALARARAIAAALAASGVPTSAIRLDAEAEGHGGAARIAP